MESGTAPDPSLPSLSPADREELSRLAWEALELCVEGKPHSGIQLPAGAEMGKPRAVFVTLYAGGRLRGCIGSSSPQMPLAEAVVDKAVAAARRDPRFPPVTASELDSLEVDISVLGDLVALRGGPEELLRSVRPGIHGLCVRFGEARGLLLPQVCAEHGWDAEEFLKQTSLKADLEPDAWRDPRAEVHCFTSLVFPAERPGG